MSAHSPRSTSFLLRFWKEPREDGGSPVLRCYLRNLQTGEEHYVGDPKVIFDRILVEELAEEVAAG